MILKICLFSSLKNDNHDFQHFFCLVLICCDIVFPLLDALIPRCDKEGYYMREQCKGNPKHGGSCWCVDMNGNEMKGTLKEGRAHCSKILL